MTIRSGRLITLSGIDGAGKSTVVSRLREQLMSNHNFASYQFWCKFGDHPLKHLRLSRIFTSHQNATPGSISQERQCPKALNRFYGTILLAYHLFQIRVVIRGLLRHGKNVICDRYIYDTMVDLQQELDYSMIKTQVVLGAGRIPQPDCKFLLDLPSQLAFSRKPDSRSIGFLERRRALYLQLVHECGLTLVDADQPIDMVMLLISQEIQSKNLINEGAGG